MEVSAKSLGSSLELPNKSVLWEFQLLKKLSGTQVGSGPIRDQRQCLVTGGRVAKQQACVRLRLLLGLAAGEDFGGALRPPRGERLPFRNQDPQTSASIDMRTSTAPSCASPSSPSLTPNGMGEYFSQKNPGDATRDLP